MRREQSAVELTRHLKHLLSCLPRTDSRFGIFFSCRNYLILERDNGLAILLDAENNADITTYVQQRFSTDPDQYIESLMSDRARGVFLSTHLAVECVLWMERRREPRVDIEARNYADTSRVWTTCIMGSFRVWIIAQSTFKTRAIDLFSTRPLTENELQRLTRTRHIRV
jgi:hypothetical protein